MNSKIIYEIYEFVKKKAEQNNLNRYVKSHTLEKMVLLLFYYQTQKIKYGRSFVKNLALLFGQTEKSISQSEFSKKLNHKLPISIWKNLFQFVLKKVNSKPSYIKKSILRKIQIIDSSTLDSTLSMKWAKHRKAKNGLKLHLMIDSDLAPKGFRLKNGKSSDKKSIKWAVESGFIYVFDRGYNDFKLFSWISDKNSYFVTRAYKNISYEIKSNRKIGHAQRKKGIDADQIVSLCLDRKTGEKIDFRLITFNFIDSNGKEQNFSFLTNIVDLKSDEIADIYRERWNIEVVFRWIKMYLNISHWYSRSKNGVMIQLYCALIIYMLVFFLKNKFKTYSNVIRDYCHYLGAVLFRYIQLYKINMRFQEFSQIQV